MRLKASQRLTRIAPARIPDAMTRALHALSLALGDLASRRVLRVLAQSLALTLLLFLIAGGALVFAGRWAPDHWDWLEIGRASGRESVCSTCRSRGSP